MLVDLFDEWKKANPMREKLSSFPPLHPKEFDLLNCLFDKITEKQNASAEISVPAENDEEVTKPDIKKSRIDKSDVSKCKSNEVVSLSSSSSSPSLSDASNATKKESEIKSPNSINDKKRKRETEHKRKMSCLFEDIKVYLIIKIKLIIIK